MIFSIAKWWHSEHATPKYGTLEFEEIAEAGRSQSDLFSSFPLDEGHKILIWVMPSEDTQRPRDIEKNLNKQTLLISSVY
jgi:hypothetical protein